jgi:hypothetical protein
MRKNYYEDHPNQKVSDFWMGCGISVAVTVGSWLLAALFPMVPVISMLVLIGFLLAAIYYLTFGKRRMLGLGMLTPWIVVLIVFGGCFIILRPW